MIQDGTQRWTFYSLLLLIDLNLSNESHNLLKNYSNQESQLKDQSKEVNVIINIYITFIHNNPDLRIEVPAVPG
jgi:hypothetical protein